MKHSLLQALLFPAAASLLLLPGRVEAQFPLSPALWDENISLLVQTLETNSSSFMGSDPEVPEPHLEELSGTGYNVSGSVAFPSGNFPEGTAEVTWDIGELGAALQLSSSVGIDFQVRVVETATPPVSVTEVPVHLQASGSASVVQFFGPRATSFFRFQAPTTLVLITRNLDLYGDPDSTKTTDSFTIDETPLIPPDLVVLVSMSATASMGTVSTGGAASGSATGMIDPVIEISDETIPGTSDSYRDYYVLELSDGVTSPVPVQRVTFGKLKQMFIHD
jgi:hypothetical protein